MSNNHTQPSKYSELVLNALKQAATNEIEKKRRLVNMLYFGKMMPSYIKVKMHQGKKKVKPSDLQLTLIIIN